MSTTKNLAGAALLLPLPTYLAAVTLGPAVAAIGAVVALVGCFADDLMDAANRRANRRWRAEQDRYAAYARTLRRNKKGQLIDAKGKFVNEGKTQDREIAAFRTRIAHRNNDALHKNAAGKWVDSRGRFVSRKRIDEYLSAKRNAAVRAVMS